MGIALKFPVATGGLPSSVCARRNEDWTELPLGQAASKRGPTMSSVREIPPQQVLDGQGKVIWPMKSVVGFGGSAIPNAKEVLAPKNRWNVIFVLGSVKGAVVWA